MESFILVFRPHQRPAWAEYFNSEKELVDAWVNGDYARACFAEPGENEEATIENCLASLGHDLSGLTRLVSAEETARYLADADYCGRHNRGESSVKEAAYALGWINPA